MEEIIQCLGFGLKYQEGKEQNTNKKDWTWVQKYWSREGYMGVLYILLFLSVNVLHLLWYKVLKNGIKNKEKSGKLKKNGRNKKSQ